MADEPSVYTVEEFAAVTRISRSLAYRLVKSGEVQAVRLGAAWRVPSHVVQEILGNGKEPERSPEPVENGGNP